MLGQRVWFLLQVWGNFSTYINFLFTLLEKSQMKSNLPKRLFNSFISKNAYSLITKNKTSIISTQLKALNKPHYPSIHPQYLNCQSFPFCTQKKGPLKAQEIPQQNLQIAITQDKLDNQQVQVIHTKGSLSILDKVPGPKNPQTGQLYVLMFTCGQCNAKQIKSFTKNAYHKGVVLARCIGCDKVHLVADNLGWFEDQPTNVETLHEGKVKKVHDHAAINAFLTKAFSQEEKLLHEQNTPKQETEKPQKLKY